MRKIFEAKLPHGETKVVNGLHWLLILHAKNLSWLLALKTTSSLNASLKCQKLWGQKSRLSTNGL